jgi:hypothetical protein
MTRKTTAMYGISRIDDDIHRTHAWRVSLRRRGKALVRNFADKKYGGKGRALAAAKAYRDELLERYPPLTRREFASIPRRHNRSGVTGVYRYAKKYTLADGKERESWYWEAHWPTETGQFMRVNFSVNQYGENLARRLAIWARDQGLAQIEGVFWASERGTAVDRAERTPPHKPHVKQRARLQGHRTSAQPASAIA